MKKIQFILLFAIPLLFAQTACNGVSKSSGYVFKGNIKGAANLQTTLEQAYFDRSTKNLGTVSCDGDGNFSFALKDPFESGLYSLTVGAKKMFFMLDGKESEVSVQGDLNTIDRLQVTFTGSETADCYAKMVQALYATQMTTGDQVKAFIKEKSCNPLMASFFTIQLLGRDAATYMDAFKTSSKDLSDAMPGSKYATDFATMISSVETQLAQTQSAEKIKVGDPAPNISLPGPDGKVHSLSDLKGKIVLLDFWASWCGPCRRANPHVVEMYNKYNSKGFEVFSVSLDNPGGKDKWMEAIQQDGLLWPNHVSDLQGWKSAPAAMYGVQAIPRTFLIDREGKIAVIDPRDRLEAELMKLL